MYVQRLRARRLWEAYPLSRLLSGARRESPVAALRGDGHGPCRAGARCRGVRPGDREEVEDRAGDRCDKAGRYIAFDYSGAAIADALATMRDRNKDLELGSIRGDFWGGMSPLLRPAHGIAAGHRSATCRCRCCRRDPTPNWGRQSAVGWERCRADASPSPPMKLRLPGQLLHAGLRPRVPRPL